MTLASAIQGLGLRSPIGSFPGATDARSPGPIRPDASASVRALPGVEDKTFDDALSRATRAADVRTAARSLTAQTLVLPILKELRASSTAWGPFAAGDAEKAFRPMLDLEIADRIAASPRLPVARMIEERLVARDRGRA